ncbi:metal-sulfur cluster assembly factor [Buchananella hordeovulneris]|uniref:metal-sulfur cluster assembly factor n=1 Tax=Buchananella hordeovulneris TaxID=52770 RepID=UPI000A5BECD4|nr:metal-sulfur cluster assembly factor [Buchananella hordeovulneris]MDO5081297.1 metal-sulfur cluster assembly factor [Buchananella hordeovulneris]
MDNPMAAPTPQDHGPEKLAGKGSGCGGGSGGCGCGQPQEESGCGQTAPTAADVEEALRDVIDPELGINVVDLGLLYGVHLDGAGNATLDMTLTSAACPLTDVIEDQASQALASLVTSTTINWVWMPPWGPDKITDDGREQLRALGFNV